MEDVRDAIDLLEELGAVRLLRQRVLPHVEEIRCRLLGLAQHPDQDVRRVVLEILQQVDRIGTGSR